MSTTYNLQSIPSPTFSVRDDNPFVIFRILQDIARKARGDADVIDLSRGDPGYGFVPSIRGREFGSTVLLLDSILNRTPEDRFLRYTETDTPVIEQRIAEALKKMYAQDTAERLSQLLGEFIATVRRFAEEEGKKWSSFRVLEQLFAYSRMSGGSYLKPKGEDIARIVVAGWHRSELGVPLTSEDIILTNGASHAIGALFKALGEEGCGYLKEGDTVCIASPVYAPYNSILEERGIQTLTISIDPVTGAADLSTLKKTRTSPKVLFLIDPHNPTGFSLPETVLTELASAARAQNMLMITDEVYSAFFPKKRTMLALAPERTIMINARSKIERSTGLRFGEIVTLPEGRDYIASLLGLQDAASFEQLLIFAKAPGRSGGQFHHTTFVPGPAQLLGIAHIILGKEERAIYLRGLQENRTVFYSALGLPHGPNLYYVIFDLDRLPGSKSAALSMEEKLLKLAEAGVVYIPAYRFFAEQSRSAKSILTSVRASIVNTTPERLREAARRTKEVLC